jgi:hypothetical protein
MSGIKVFAVILLFTFVSVIGFSETVFLRDGTTLTGMIVSSDAGSVVVETDIGKIEIPRYRIDRIDYATTGQVEAVGASQEQPPGVETVQTDVVDQNSTALSPAGGAPDAPSRGELELRKEQLELMLLEKKFLRESGIRQMQNLASPLPLSERLLMYSAHRRSDQGIGAGLNFFVPSLGSWVQGDVGGAVFQDILLGLGIFFITNPLDLSYGFGEDENGSATRAEDNDSLLFTGIGILAFNWLFGVVHPFNYVRNWNLKISTALDIRSAASSAAAGSGITRYGASDPVSLRLAIMNRIR